MESTAAFKVWSSVLLVNVHNFDRFVQGHEIYRTLYKVVLFAKLSDDDIKDGVSRFHFLAHHFTHRFSLNSDFRLLFAVYNLDIDPYPGSLPVTTSRTPIAKLLVMKSLSDKVREFGGELDAYSFRNNCSMFISECIKSFQRSKRSVKKGIDSWYKCIDINEVSFYTERPGGSSSDASRSDFLESTGTMLFSQSLLPF